MKSPPIDPFVDLTRAEPEETAAADDGLFLGRFTTPAVERELEAAGILAALSERGYEDVAVDTDFQDGHHRLRVVTAGQAASLVDLRVSEATCVFDDPLAEENGLDALYLLAVHWLELRHPTGSFTDRRPQSPGQTVPGLGISRRFFGLLTTWAHAWGKDGILIFPPYYHNAVFSSKLFRFVSPARQGRLEALRRDLGSLHVCAASAAIEEGRVTEDPSRRVVAWEPAEMLAPVTRAPKELLDSKGYRTAVQRAREAARFSVLP